MRRVAQFHLTLLTFLVAFTPAALAQTSERLVHSIDFLNYRTETVATIYFQIPEELDRGEVLEESISLHSPHGESFAFEPSVALSPAGPNERLIVGGQIFTARIPICASGLDYQYHLRVRGRDDRLRSFQLAFSESEIEALPLVAILPPPIPGRPNQKDSASLVQKQRHFLNEVECHPPSSTEAYQALKNALVD